jgi:AraC-like DNA-binding protein
LNNVEDMKHFGFVSIAAVKQYLRYAEGKKLDTQQLIERSNLREALKSEDEGRITGEQFQTFLKHLILKADDPLLGLSSALYVKTNSYTILGLIAESSSTLEEIIKRIPLFERLVGDMGTTSLQRTQTGLIQTWNCHYTNPLLVPHMVDNVLASWTLYARWLSGSSAAAERVCLRRPKPEAHIEREYQAVFSCPVEFDAKQDQIYLSESLLNTKLQPRHDRAQWNLEGKARSELSQVRLTDEPFASQVRRTINAHLQLGIAKKELIAEEFNLSLRTIQRKLAADKTSYRTLLDNARHERAQTFLNDTLLSANEIAYNLGYADERCFYRSFKEWSGFTPEQYRKQLIDFNKH